MIAHGLKGLLEFLDFLKERKISYSIFHSSHESLSVYFTLVGVRVEVEFFEDHFEFSYFSGDEGVSTSENELRNLIDNYSGD